MSDEFVTVELPTHKRFKNLTGRVFGRLTVVSFAGMLAHGSATKKLASWNCICACGKNKTPVIGSKLLVGDNQSCGCLVAEFASTVLLNTRITHGLSNSPEYNAWRSMINRCTRPNNKDWGSYGGRGITVCSEWLNSFELWFMHIGPRPGPGYTQDRIKTDGNYEPGNVKWSTTAEQSRNQRRTVFLDYNGERKCITDWAEELGIPKDILGRRIRAGWSYQDALTTPVKKLGPRLPKTTVHASK